MEAAEIGVISPWPLPPLISYSWDFGVPGSKENSTSPSPEFTYSEPGIYNPTLTITDENGNNSSASIEVKAGNDPPNVSLEITGNRSFYFDKQSINYKVSVVDVEDGSLENSGIAPEDVMINFVYYPDGSAKNLGHQTQDNASSFSAGKNLIDRSDCRACHNEVNKSIGPSYMEIAKRYLDQQGAAALLTEKVINGGSGNWGDQPMAAHPQLAAEDVKK